jgi:FkbM family methyltransferase
MRQLAALAPDRAEALWLGLVVLSLPIKKRLGKLHRAHARVRVQDGDSVHTLYVSEHADFEVLVNVFVHEEFAVLPPWEPRTVLDIGAHIGLTVLMFRRLFPAAAVIAVEPNPYNFAKLKRNVGHLENVRLVPAAVAGESGTARFDAELPSWASRLLRDDEDGAAVAVPIRSLDAIVSEFDIDVGSCFVKLDTEGIEWEVLSKSKATGDFLAIVGDLHRDLIPVPADRFFDLFEGYEVSGRDAPSLFYAIQREAKATTGIGPP